MTLTLGLAPTAAALDATVHADHVKSKCVGLDSVTGKPTISWRGGRVDYYGFWNPSIWAPHGKSYHCYTLYQLGSKTADGDYYAMELETVWTSQGEWNHESAIASQYVSSNTATKDSRFGYTPTYVSNYSCSTAISVSFSVGPIRIGTPISMCSGETVTATGGQKVANWTVERAAKVRSIITTYSQKVAHGAKPTYNVWFTVPYYTYRTWYDINGNPHYEVTERAWKNYIYNVAVP